MSNEITKEPEIRFDGYKGDWEQRKLGNVTEKIGSGKTPKGGNATYQTEGVPLIRSQNIFNNRFNQNDVAYISKKIDDEMKNSRVYTGDILLNITGASIGRSAVYRQKMAANVNQHVCIIRPKKEYYSDFIQLNISSSKGQREIDLNQAGGGREGLNFQQISKMSFFYPSVEEQQKIGSFFKQLDDTIALHQREVDLLERTKQTYLQKMFPKTGEDKPEIRFAGFTDAWEQRKLGEVAKDISDGDWIEKEHIFDDGEYRIIQTGNLGEGEYLDKPNNAKYFYQKDFDEIKANEIFAGDLLISRLAEPAGRTIILPATNHRMVTAVDVTIIRPDDSFDSTFLMTQMNSSQTLNKVGKSVSGTSHKRISRKNLEKINLLIPSLNEQKRIGSFFKQLDHTITLHQRKLDSLKEMKKTLLQKMFV